MLRERYAKLTGAERLIMGAGMFETARALALASFPPGLTTRETRRRCANDSTARSPSACMAGIEALLRNRAVNVFAVSHFDYINDEFPVFDRINESIKALPNPVTVMA
jgi:hypothetical protein